MLKRIVLINVIVFIILLVGICIYACLFYKTAGYSITENEIKCQKGVIFKKISIIERQKINAINTKQSIIARLLHAKHILVDSGSTNTAFKAEFSVLLDDDIADSVYKQIKAIRDKKDNADGLETIISSENDNIICDCDYDYGFTSKSKLIYSVSNAITMIVVATVLFVIAIAAIFIIDSIHTIDSFWLVFLWVSLIYICLSSLSSIISLIQPFFSYYDFKIKKTKSSIQISHGLFTKIDHSIEYSKIRGIMVKQNPLMRIFGYASIYLNVVGYGIESNNNSKNNDENTGQPGILIPLCKISDVNVHLENLIGRYYIDDKEIKCKNILPFLTWTNLALVIITILISSVITILALKVNKNFYYGFIGVGAFVVLYEICLIINAIMSKITGGLTINEDKVTVYFGSITKNITVIYKNNIIGIEDISTHMRRKRGIYSYVIHFHNNSTLNTVRVNNIPQEALSSLLSLTDINNDFVKNNIEK